MPRIVTLYNNKGGVSKTTTVFNLGVYLAKEKGQKVLFIDCDPQSNLTELFFASAHIDVDLELPGSSLYAILDPRFRGDRGRVDIESVELTESNIYKNLYLLRSDFNLGAAENYLSAAVLQAITENVNEKQTYLVLHRLFNGLADLYNFDHVFIDVGPSVGALSRMAFLSSDAFFVPITPDRFCLQAISVLQGVFDNWKAHHKRIIDSFPSFGLETFSGEPEYLGAVSQNFKTWGGKAKTSYQTWETRIGNALMKAFGSSANGKAYIAQISDVGPLAPISQIFGRAIFDVKQHHTSEASTTGSQYYGVVWKNWEERMAQYEIQMEHMAKVIIDQ